MADLAEFLQARVAEDEAAARAAGGEWGNGLPATIHPDLTVYRTVTRGVGYVCGSILAADAEHIARWDPARVLAKCKADRRIVALHNPCDDWSYGDAAGCPELRALALPYADHPDYRQEWRP